MKRKLLIALAFILTFSGGLVATAAVKAVNGSYDGFAIVKLFSRGEELKPAGTPGILYKSSTLIPIGVLRDLGVKVDWDGTKQSVNVTLPPTKSVLSDDDIALLANRTVAHIYAVDDQGNAISQGTGFVIKPNGLLVTAFHVVEEKGSFYNLKVILNGKTYLIPKDQYVYRDEVKDVYAVRLPEGLYDYIPIGTGGIKENDLSYALGYPKGVYKTVSGTVMKPRKDDILFKMFVDSGTSGGVLIDSYGEAIGVITNGDEYLGRATLLSKLENVLN